MNTDKQPQTEDRIIPVIEEKWDEFSTYIDYDLSSSSINMVVGTSVINKSDFTKAVLSVIKETHLLLTPEELEALLQKEREADQWISVKDRLPHIDTYVQVYTLNKLFSPISNIITKYSRYGFESASGVTHWMPLPQPPKQ